MTDLQPRCVNPQHDHTTPVDRDGIDLPAPIRMLCNDCAKPTHYDSAVEQYVHDEDDARGCFLIPERPEGATPCTIDEYAALVLAIGDGFHPDTRGSDYVSLPDGYTPERVDTIVAAAVEALDDPYAVANVLLDSDRAEFFAERIRADFGHMRSDFASDPGGWLDYSGEYRGLDDVTAAAAIALVLGEWGTS